MLPLLADLNHALRSLSKSPALVVVEKTGTPSRKELLIPRTVVLKLKTSDFKILTRCDTPASPATQGLAKSLLYIKQIVPRTLRLGSLGLQNRLNTASAEKALKSNCADTLKAIVDFVGRLDYLPPNCW